MATTGAKFPTLAETISEAPWSDNTWSTPGNIVSDDGTTAIVNAASYDSPDQTFVLKGYSFDFSSIPDGSTIDGVICVVNNWVSAGTASIDLLQLLDVTRAKVGTNQCATAVVLGTANTNIVTKGSSTDLWGNTLTVAWVKDPDFGVAIGNLATSANADVQVDYVTLEIFYTAPAGPSPITGTTAGTSTVGATLYGKGTITGNTPAASTASSAIIGKGALSGNITGSTILISTLSSASTTSPITGVTIGTTTLSGILIGKGIVQGSVNGITVNNSILIGHGTIIAVTLGLTTVGVAGNGLSGKGMLSAATAGTGNAMGVFSGGSSATFFGRNCGRLTKGIRI